MKAELQETNIQLAWEIQQNWAGNSAEFQDIQQEKFSRIWLNGDRNSFKDRLCGETEYSLQQKGEQNRTVSCMNNAL